MNPILVTGAAKGLGAAICQALAERGHDVVIHYRASEKEASDLTGICRSCNVQAEAIQGDFATFQSTEDFIRRYVERFPHTKGIVNNVGNYFIAPPNSTLQTQWPELFQTNFFAPIAITQALLPAIKEAKGSILNIGVVGLKGERAMVKATTYASTKSALWLYTLALAKEVIMDGVRVNMLSPAYMENAVDLKDPEQLPLKRPAKLAEMAAIAALFFDPITAYVTGQNLEVAGGTGL